MDSQEDSASPEASEEFDDRREETYRDHRFADDGPTRGTLPDNGHTGVEMSPEGKPVATAEGTSIREEGMSDQVNMPDQPEARVPGSLLDDRESPTS